jgi:multidrug efflux pump subunit AcrB
MVDIGTMMTASVAMGIAVDDTIHFLTWFRRGLDQGQSRQRAILLAYQRVGTAMVQTTLIGGLGLSIFALSTFTPTQRFGTLMLAMLMAALVGDLVFLPALLASPLGRVFRTRQAIPDSSPSQFAPHIPVSAQPGASPTQSSQSRSENDAAFTRVRPDVALGT